MSAPPPSGLPTLTEVRAAKERIASGTRRTPVLQFRDDLWLKLEELQVTGSFKARGALNALRAAPPDRLVHGVVTASGGNHGLGVAYAARAVGVPARVWLPAHAPASSERRLLAYGATVGRHGSAWDDAWERACADAASDGALLVHPFEDAAVIAGQGTVGLELAEALPELDEVVVAIGGGGLAAGVALALKSLRPKIRVVGVEPTGAASMSAALAAGRPVALERIDTIATTLAPRSVGPNTLALAAAYLDEILLVSDAELIAAQRLLWSELRLLVEPAGAATLAAIDSGRLGAGRRRAALLCGANLDPEAALKVLEAPR